MLFNIEENLQLDECPESTGSHATSSAATLGGIQPG